MPDTELKMNVADPVQQKPPPFVPSQAGLTPPMDDNMVKALFDQAAKQGIDDLNTPITIPAQVPLGEPKTVEALATSVPEKFKKADGTVDEDKLKASTEQLDKGIEQKKKSIDELIADYRAKEKEYQKVSEQKAEVSRGVQSMPIASEMRPPVPVTPMAPDMQALQAQIQADYQRDPINTQIMLAQAAAQRLIDERMAPVQDALSRWQERERDQQMRQSLDLLAQSDPRILDPRLHAVTMQVMGEDPGMMRLKNPYKAAWNEVKERLRLGEPAPAQVQPSNPSPMLGGGSPPLVSTLPVPSSPQTLFQNAQTVNPYSDEGKRFEEQLKAVTKDLWST